MKNKLFLAGMLAMALTFGLIMTGCKQDADDDGGGGGSVTLEVVNEYSQAVKEIRIFATPEDPQAHSQIRNAVWVKTAADLVPVGGTETFSSGLQEGVGYIKVIVADNNGLTEREIIGEKGKTTTVTVKSNFTLEVGQPH